MASETDLTSANETDNAEDNSYKKLLALNPDGILVFDERGYTLYTNPKARELLNIPNATIGIEQLGIPFGINSGTREIERNDKILELQLVVINWEGKKATLVALRDITEHRENQEKLTQQNNKLRNTNNKLETLSSTDPLTELLNRRGFHVALTEELDRSRRQGSQMVAIFLDLDDFKSVNEAFGHAIGDVALKLIAAELTSTLRSSDHAARIGGDEFILLLPDTRLAEGIVVAQRLRESIATTPLHAGGRVNYISASFGVISVPPEATSLEELMSLARDPLAISKNEGKNRVASTRDIVTTPSPKALLDSILASQTPIRVVQQPIYQLDGETLIGYEFLSRGSAGTLELPQALFQVAADNNVLNALDLICLKACIHASNASPTNNRKHFNILPSTLLTTPLDTLLSLLRTHNGPLCLELSEQQFIGDPAPLRDPIAQLKAHGITIALDDVGFGRSSLEALIVLAPSIVKIDRSFTYQIEQDPTKLKMLQRLTSLIHTLHSESIADGIETREQLTQLQQLHIKCGQGSFWGQPKLL